MADHVTLAHDNTKSGSWEHVPRKRNSVEEELITLYLRSYDEAMDTGDIDRARVAMERVEELSEAYTASMLAKPNRIDTGDRSDHTENMNDITREEFNAKLETIEVKMDARVEAMSSKIDAFLAAQGERDKRLDESLSNIRGDISSLGSLKLTIWGAMFTGLAITLTVIGLGLTAYQAGQADRKTVEQPVPTTQVQPAK